MGDGGGYGGQETYMVVILLGYMKNAQTQCYGVESYGIRP